MGGSQLSNMSEQTSDMVRRYPFVSVVVPVFNSPDRAKTCIEALLRQAYPKDRHEIIVVDNGSTDNTQEVIQQYPVTFLVEDSIQSPYPARNKGINHARGEIIAMLDVNCTPVSGWLENGVQSLESESADLVGGKVTFTFSPKRTVAESFDSISNIKMKSSIENRGVAKGLNLFVRKHVFQSIDLFPAHVRSGGDVLWTGRATRAGHKLIYSPRAEAFYPARKLLPLLGKSYRVGKGQPLIWMDQGQSLLRIMRSIAWDFRSPKLSFIRKILMERGTKEMQEKLLSIWLVAWLCTIATNMGRISFVLRRVF
jgi:glycosyltransferase involved in cell wall biosynthesis